jgi:hypothetical protein
MKAQQRKDPSFETNSDFTRMMNTAASLTETCYEMYHQQASGVSPEFVEFPPAGPFDFINGAGYYLLRPETMEALFYMWRLTRQQKWRDMGWEIFRAIERWCRVPSGGFAGLKDVNVRKPLQDNLQQSFWFAETLKYAYLLFAPDTALDLNEWVLNTEAHPIRIRKRDPMDIWRDYEDGAPTFGKTQHQSGGGGAHDGGAFNGHAGVPDEVAEQQDVAGGGGAYHGRRGNKKARRVLWRPPAVPGVLQRTETDRMRAARLRGDPAPELLRDYSMVDSAMGGADDDGLPFDAMRGPRGVPRIDKSRAARPAAFMPVPVDPATNLFVEHH